MIGAFLTEHCDASSILTQLKISLGLNGISKNIIRIYSNSFCCQSNRFIKLSLPDFSLRLPNKTIVPAFPLVVCR